jgi:Skp family chaperone for outer membrane proteins
MYNGSNQTKEQKRILDNINMVLNDLEQKLGGNEELCQGIAKIIDMTVELKELVARLSDIESNIPEIKDRIRNLILSCIASCSQERDRVMNAIRDNISDRSEERKKKYMSKIQKTIDNCVENYSIYKESRYNAKYCVNRNSEKPSADYLSMIL